MLNPVRLFVRSLGQFARGLAPGLVLAFACLAIQIALVTVVVAGREAVAPSTTAMRYEPTGPYDSRDDVRRVVVPMLYVSIPFFFHALVALLVTAWLLRRRAGFDRMQALRRAARGAALLTGVSAVIFAAAFFVDDVLPATRFIRFNFSAAAIMGVWFAATALLLPARLMGHRPAFATGVVRPTIVAAIAVLPWFHLSEIMGMPLRHCHECGGFFEGVIFFLPLLGAYLLGLTVSSAAVSAAACMPLHGAAKLEVA